MPIENVQIKKINIRELQDGKDNYVIPIYQRNYAWDSKEIEQLIQDIIDCRIHYGERSYYIGTLVVVDEKKCGVDEFSVIDGQQRLTTLFIISAVIKNKYKDVDMDWFGKINLRFASRTKSDISIKGAYNDCFDEVSCEKNIIAAYQICERELIRKTVEHRITIKEFAEYLFQYVIILRVPLPQDIDFNHYFEIMNSRGEQLEKHEVLKARLMKCFNNFEINYRNNCEACFNLIWDACSNMEKYVQYGFSPDQRHIVFGEKDWNILALSTFDELVERLANSLSNIDNTDIVSLDDILNCKLEQDENNEDKDHPERFNSVVNFPNFLLHVLRLQVGKDEVALDDKRLLEIFEREIPSEATEYVNFAKEFVYNLLKCKFLYDKYIIKREFNANSDRWSLMSLKWYSTGNVKNGVKYENTIGDKNNNSSESDNRKILMLLSMFHVSVPSMAYKNWLYAAMNYLFHRIQVDSTAYIDYLEYIAKAFVFDRYLAIKPDEYSDMIRHIKRTQRTVKQLNLDKLRFGQIMNNLVFNFLDYLLWDKYKSIEIDNRVKTFEFTFRSSVEHYYPQTPFNDNIERLNPKYLHSFGNLCLVSHEKNSRLSNFTPQAKKDTYSKSNTLDSLKQFFMMKYQNWTVEEIEAHETEMVNLLIENMNSTFQPT